MIIKSLREFFLACPLFAGRVININYLGYREGDCSIEPSGTFNLIKTYCDGKRVFTRDFALGIRCAFDENTQENIRDVEFLERLALWIEQQNLIGNMPMLSDGMEAVRVSVKKMPHLFESSVQGARMQLEFTLTYREI